MNINAELQPGWVVYRIVNLVNQKAYVGVTGNLKRRIQGHMTKARCGMGTAIHAAIRKYGDNQFVVDVLDLCDSQESALALEQVRIAELGTLVAGYNLTAGGDGIRSLAPESMKRLRVSLSAALRGKPKSPAHRASMSECRMGMKFSPTHLENLSIAMTGRKASDASRAKMSLLRKGKPLSEQHREKIGNALRGRVFTEQTLQNMRAGARAARGRQVECIESGQVFTTILDAVSWLKVNGAPKADPSAIGRVCRGRVPRAYGYSWRYSNDSTHSIAGAAQ